MGARERRCRGKYTPTPTETSLLLSDRNQPQHTYATAIDPRGFAQRSAPNATEAATRSLPSSSRGVPGRTSSPLCNDNCSHPTLGSSEEPLARHGGRPVTNRSTGLRHQATDSSTTTAFPTPSEVPWPAQPRAGYPPQSRGSPPSHPARPRKGITDRHLSLGHAARDGARLPRPSNRQTVQVLSRLPAFPPSSPRVPPNRVPSSHESDPRMRSDRPTPRETPC